MNAIKFHTPLTLAEAADLLAQAVAKRDALDLEFRELTKSPHAPYPPTKCANQLRTVGGYYGELKRVAEDVRHLVSSVDQAKRGMGTIHSEQMWALAESLGLKYPQIQED